MDPVCCSRYNAPRTRLRLISSCAAMARMELAPRLSCHTPHDRTHARQGGCPPRCPANPGSPPTATYIHVHFMPGCLRRVVQRLNLGQYSRAGALVGRPLALAVPDRAAGRPPHELPAVACTPALPRRRGARRLVPPHVMQCHGCSPAHCRTRRTTARTSAGACATSCTRPRICAACSRVPDCGGRDQATAPVPVHGRWS